MAEIRFFLDEHIPRPILRGLQRREIDAVRPQDIGRDGLPDEAQLAWAFDEGRVMVTFDQDYLKIASGNVEHAGIAFCYPDKYGIGELIGLLIMLYELVDSEEMRNQIEYL